MAEFATPNTPLIVLLVCHEFHCAFTGIAAASPKAKIIRFFFILYTFIHINILSFLPGIHLSLKDSGKGWSVMVIVLKVFVLSKHDAKIQHFSELTNILPTFFVMPQKSQRVSAPCDLYLLLQEHRFSAIVLWSYCEVQPIAAIPIPLYQQFVIVLSGLVGVVHQDHRISHRLLDASHPDIHSATR
jgi:hypothetical protein